MKFILALVLLSSMTSAFSKDISLNGLSSKALMDTLLSNEKLRVFQDGGMGKIYLSLNDINCMKNTFPRKEMIACTFHGDDENTTVTLYSNEDRGLEEIRYALVEASKAETQSTETLKELKIKKLDCKVSGLGHVLDDNGVELKYSCNIQL